jgi:predicted RNA-binding protein YlxR (DUF448 family)
MYYSAFQISFATEDSKKIIKNIVKKVFSRYLSASTKNNELKTLIRNVNISLIEKK